MEMGKTTERRCVAVIRGLAACCKYRWQMLFSFDIFLFELLHLMSAIRWAAAPLPVMKCHFSRDLNVLIIYRLVWVQFLRQNKSKIWLCVCVCVLRAERWANGRLNHGASSSSVLCELPHRSGLCGAALPLSGETPAARWCNLCFL